MPRSSPPAGGVRHEAPHRAPAAAGTRTWSPRPSVLFDADVPAHQLHELLRNRQPQPRAAVVARGGTIHLAELLEKQLAASRRNADAGVAAPETRMVGLPLGPRCSQFHRDHAPRRARVNLMALPTRLVTTCRMRPRIAARSAGTSGGIFQHQVEPLSLGLRGQHLVHVFDQLPQVEIDATRSAACRPRSSRSPECR